jgi:RNA recognition motif-containing protein
MTSSATLRQYFSQYGRIVDAAVLTDAEKRSRGFAFVDFEGEVPEAVLHTEHVIDQRRCGVRKYAYPTSWAR